MHLQWIALHLCLPALLQDAEDPEMAAQIALATRVAVQQASASVNGAGPAGSVGGCNAWRFH